MIKMFGLDDILYIPVFFVIHSWKERQFYGEYGYNHYKHLLNPPIALCDSQPGTPKRTKNHEDGERNGDREFDEIVTVKYDGCYER